MKIFTFCSLAWVLASAFCFVQSATSQLLPGTISKPTKRKVPATKAKEFPYQVGILLKDNEGETSWCGGSLISNEFVLTAAHCIEDIEEGTVYLGARRIGKAKVVHKVNKKNLVLHPEWDADNLINDIGLIRIPFTKYTKNIRPVKLPEANGTVQDYDEVITSGWSRDASSFPGNKVALKWSEVYVMGNTECSNDFFKFLKDSHICTISFGLSPSCRIDPGGPLVLKSNGVQIGINSFVTPKGCADAPLGFTRVSVFLDWLKEQTTSVDKY